uniref:RIP metalloprotease RseP n=1 Tax=Parerythrobacter lutipelagi TaxID=1964208 RepID=UPI001F00DF70|nr:RIP metalloprotease RseP [Parerythrobacter lutipelagi]
MQSVPWWMWILGFLLVLGPLVTIHELGHYLVGRLFGVKAEAFSVGFGKELAGYTDTRGTRWKLSMLPLGGYVQFKGDMDPASIPHPDELAKMPAAERGDSFHFKPLWQRALIVFAGPATNILVAVAIFAAFFMAYGKPVPVESGMETVIARFAEQSSAREAGMQVGDRILAVDGQAVASLQEVTDQIVLYPERSFDFTIERDGEQQQIKVTTDLSVTTDEFGNESKLGRIGVYSSPLRFEPVGPGSAVTLALDQCATMARMMVVGIKQIITGQRGLDELGGPLKIAKYSGEQLSLGPQPFVWFIALISLNLAFINLLPIPALDGGHLAFYAAEAVRRKPIGPRGTEIAYRTGIAIVLVLMVFVTVNDVLSLPWFGS